MKDTRDPEFERLRASVARDLEIARERLIPALEAVAADIPLTPDDQAALRRTVAADLQITGNGDRRDPALVATTVKGMGC